MAYDKIIPIKKRLDHCVNYILNPEKTGLGQVLEYIGNGDKTITPDGKLMLQSAVNCQLSTAYQEMRATKQRWGKKGGVQGYHLVHSYAPGEVTPEQAHTMGLEFVQQLLQDKYEVVVATHLDHDHIHCHILFNSVSLLDGKKYRDNFQAYFGDIRGASNAVSRKHGLSVIEPEGSGKSYAEWDAHKKGKPTVRDLIRQDIDAFIAQSFTYASFLSDSDLSMLQSALQADIDALVQERKSLYKVRRQGIDADGQINSINEQLRQLRSKLKTCDQIQADIPHVRAQLQEVQAREQMDKDREKAKPQKNERRFTPWM